MRSFSYPYNTRIAQLVGNKFPRGLRHEPLLPDRHPQLEDHPRLWFQARDVTLAIDTLDGIPDRNRVVRRKDGGMATRLAFNYFDYRWLKTDHPDIAKEIIAEIRKQYDLGMFYASTGTGAGPIDEFDDPKDDQILAWLRENPGANLNAIYAAKVIKIGKQALGERLRALAEADRIVGHAGGGKIITYTLPEPPE